VIFHGYVCLPEGNPFPTPFPSQEIVGADINWSSRQAKAAAKSAVKHITVASAERKPEEAGNIQGFLGSGWILVLYLLDVGTIQVILVFFETR
jgi:hypothetical protein